MTDENEKIDSQENEEEKPEIYSVKKGEKGFAYNRRGFLVTAAAGAAAMGAIGMGVGALMPDGQTEATDENGKVSLEIEALGSALVWLAKTVEATWKITNQGKNPSPKGVLNLAAAHDSEFRLTLDVPEITPGQTVEVPASLTAPGTSGEYRYQWQLRLGDGDARMNDFVLKVTDALPVESAHPYVENTDYTWTIDNPDTAAAHSEIHFTRVEVEQDYDYVFVRDGSGNVIQTLSGIYPTGGWSEKVPGYVVQVRLTSDYDVNYWGFKVDAIRTSAITYHTYLPFIRRPTPTPVSYTVCLCNTVDLCTCNLVCVCDSYCSCNVFCSCDTVCSCVGYCSCNSVHYWYPN